MWPILGDVQFPLGETSTLPERVCARIQLKLVHLGDGFTLLRGNVPDEVEHRWIRNLVLLSECVCQMHWVALIVHMDVI
jgi:hypothetical protein